MPLPNIERFLFNLELDYAGKFIGWISVIGFGFMAVFFGGIALSGLWIDSVPGVIRMLFYMLVIDGMFFTYVCYCSLMFIAGICLIVGIYQQDHQKLSWYLHSVAIGTIVSPAFTAAYTDTVQLTVLVTILLVIAHIYIFLCVHSLYEKYRQRSDYAILDSS